MAIAFVSSSTAAATSALAAAAIQTAWRDALVAHASGAWTLADEFDSAGGTIHWVVIKNDTTISGVGNDFYIAIGRVAASGQMYILLGETYTIATKLLSDLAPNPDASGAYTVDAQGRSTQAGLVNFTLGAGVPGSNPGPSFLAPLPAASGRYYSMIEADHCMLGTADKPVGYFGAITSLVTGVSDPVAILGGDLIPSPWALTTGPGMTRHPNSVGATSIRNGHKVIGVTPSGLPCYTARNFIELVTSNFASGDRNQASKAFASDVLAVMCTTFGSSSGLPSALGALRGQFKNLKFAIINPAMVFADQLLIDNKKHILVAKGTGTTPQGYSIQAAINVGFSLGLLVNTGVAGP